MAIPFFTGFGNFFKNLWTACTGADTPRYFTKRGWSKGLAAIPEGAVIVERGQSWIGGAIRKVTGEWANHIIGYLGNDVTVEAMPNGVGYSKLSEKETDKCQMIVFVKTDITAAQVGGISGYLRGAVGKPYAYFKLATEFLIGGDDSSNATEFCSEVERRAYASQGITISKDSAQKTSPGEIGVYLIGTGIPGEGWQVFDTYNITLEDALKTGYDLIK